jgi:hypothetical protein
MAESISLLDFLLRLINDDDLRQEFNADPEDTLEAYNLTDLSAQDVYDALVLAQDSHQASFDRNYDTGFHNTVPPVPAHAGYSGGGHHDGGHGHKEAVEYINKYITNNYIDDRDTIVDNSINQNIDNRGGIFNQDIDVDSVVASGDGAVAAGDDVRDNTIVSGDDNILAGGNVTQTGDVTAGDGGAISFGGNATGNYEDNDTTSTVTNFGDGAVAVNTAGAGGTATQTTTQAVDNSTTNTTTHTNSHNTDSGNISDSFQSDDDFTLGSYNDVASHNTDNSQANDNDGLDIG